MNKELLKFIRILSENDHKNLCGKALKTAEEVGELAKAVLPFENSAGTLHRFSDKKMILDNVADVILSAISIAYDLECTDEEIEEMMIEKSEKWLGIQAREREIKFPIPYEIHITIERPKDIEKFKDVCKHIGVKPIIIDFEKNDELVMQDVMTSSVHYGDNRSAYNEAQSIGVKLLTPYNYWDSEKYTIIRTKIETVPWHPAAPNRLHRNNIMPKDCYFESHIRIIANEEDKHILRSIALVFDAHLSRNFFKKINDKQYIIMMTLRSYTDTYENFKSKVDSLKKSITDVGYFIDKTEIEFAIYDTKISHDFKWLE